VAAVPWVFEAGFVAGFPIAINALARSGSSYPPKAVLPEAHHIPPLPPDMARYVTDLHFHEK
jgi:hypothetical protein